MSGLIKRAQLHHRPARSAPTVVAPDHARIAALEAQVHALTAQLKEERADADERERHAHAQGIDEGRAVARQERDAHGEALTKALVASSERALVSFDRDLVQASEQLALALAHAGLERVLGDASRYADLVAQTVAHQLAHLAAQSVVAVAVSAHDFPLQAPQLEPSLADARIEFHRHPHLPSGGCTITLRVGELDASIPTQWRNLRKLLTDGGDHA